MASGLENIETIESPFRRFVTTIGVFPTAFTDAMTYYECLAYLVKYLEETVIPAVNQNAEALEELQQLYIQLKSYVDNYFDNLDVQEEINNKLDEMATSGQLTALIKQYIDPIFSEYQTEINAEIDDISSRVQASYSGTPIPVNSTSLMTDTTKTYLLTTDGYWYYYNGSAWTQGGVYQATGLDADSVLPTNIKDHHTYNPAIYDGLEVGKFSSNGVLVNAANWSCTDFIAVKTGDVINVNLARGVWVEQFDENKNYVTHQNTDDTSHSIEVNYTITSNTSYIRFNIFNADYNSYVLKINNETYYGIYGIDWLRIGRYNLDDELKEIIDSGNVPSFMRKWVDTDMIMFGDSLVSAELDTGNKGGYVGRLKTNLSLNVATNMGISGRPMANGTPNGAGTNTTIKSVNTFPNYELCLIAAGTNDFKLNVPLGNLGVIGDTTFDTNTFYGAYRDAIEYILGQNPNIRICLWTPLQRNNGGYDVNTVNTAGFKLIDYVNAIKKVGEMYGIPVLDLYSTSGVTQLTLSTFTVDGLHLNGHGYDVITLYASSCINNI